jgi:hypothetical protein
MVFRELEGQHTGGNARSFNCTALRPDKPGHEEGEGRLSAPHLSAYKVQPSTKLAMGRK